MRFIRLKVDPAPPVASLCKKKWPKSVRIEISFIFFCKSLPAEFRSRSWASPDIWVLGVVGWGQDKLVAAWLQNRIWMSENVTCWPGFFFGVWQRWGGWSQRLSAGRDWDICPASKGTHIFLLTFFISNNRSTIISLHKLHFSSLSRYGFVWSDRLNLLLYFWGPVIEWPLTHRACCDRYRWMLLFKL